MNLTNKQLDNCLKYYTKAWPVEKRDELMGNALLDIPLFIAMIRGLNLRLAYAEELIFSPERSLISQEQLLEAQQQEIDWISNRTQALKLGYYSGPLCSEDGANMRLTTDPSDPRLGRGVATTPGPQNEVYLVLSAEERAKGFVRPLRMIYKHTGKRPKYTQRQVTSKEKAQKGFENYVLFESYPDTESPLTGRFWTQEELTSGCGFTTKMGRELSETYARNPTFYGLTYCCHCRLHKPVEEFRWVDDNAVVGS